MASASSSSSVRTFSTIRIDKTSGTIKTEGIEKQSNSNASKNTFTSFYNNFSKNATNASNSNTIVVDLGKSLLQSARDGDVVKVLDLINRGAPFSVDWLGMTALHFAAVNNHPKICEILIRGGINKDAKTKVDRTPLHLAVYEGHRNVVDLLISKECEINCRDMLKMTPLHWAIEKHHKIITKTLLANGAEVDVVSKLDKTPISLAIQTGQTDLLDELHLCQESLKQKEKLKNDQNENETNQAVNSITLNNSSLDNDVYQLCDVDDEYIEQKPTIYNVNKKAKMKEFLNMTCTETPVQSTEDSTTLEMLKDLKSLLPPDDGENNELLVSALQNGRKLVLSEGGRLAFNEARIRQNYENLSNNTMNVNKQEQSIDENESRKISNDVSANGAASSTSNKAVLLKCRKQIPLKTSGKNIKVISMDTFKKLFGKDAVKSIKKNNTNINKSPVQQQNLLTKLTKFTKITNLNQINARKSIFNQQSPTGNSPLIPLQKLETANECKSPEIIEPTNKEEQYEDLPPNIIEIFTDDDEDDDIERNHDINADEYEEINIQPKVRSISNLSTELIQSTNSSSNKQIFQNQRGGKSFPLLEIPEICLQLFDLQKQNVELRNELNFMRQENEEYRNRLERLESNMENLANM